MATKKNINKVLNMRTNSALEISGAVSEFIKPKTHKVNHFKRGGGSSFPLAAAVAQGSLEPLIVEVYNYDKLSTSPVVLVGKGVVYDTGGYSLKPSNNMNGMHFDKSGAILVAAYCAKHKDVPGIVFYAANMVSSYAYLPGSIIKSRNKTRVLITNTDAEGRLGLADCLSYVKDKNSSAQCITVATLTGAASYTTGNNIRSLFHTTDVKLRELLIKNEKSHKLWPMFTDKEYDKSIKSKVDGADIENSSLTFYGAGSQTAYSFLKHFNKNLHHIDMAGFGEDKDGNCGAYTVIKDIDFIVKYLKNKKK